jgi:hypothetical protein
MDSGKHKLQNKVAFTKFKIQMVAANDVAIFEKLKIGVQCHTLYRVIPLMCRQHNCTSEPYTKASPL